MSVIEPHRTQVQWVTGSVSVVSDSSVVTTVTGSVAVTNQVSVTGSVGITGPVTVTFGATTLKTYDTGVQAVSGSQLTGSTAAGFPVAGGGTDSTGILRGIRTNTVGETLISVSSSLPVTFSGQVQVTGTVNLDRGNNAAAPLFITGSLSTTAPAVTAVTGSQLTGSTFTDRPVVVGGVDASGIVRGIRTGQNGEVSIMLTGSLPVTIASQIGINNFPAIQAVTGSVSVFTQGAQLVSGTVSVGNWPPTIGVSSSFPLRVFDTGTTAVTGSVSVYTQGAQFVSGVVSVGNWPTTIGVSSSFTLKVWDPGTMAVSGSNLTGSTFNGFPFVVGVNDPATNTVKAVLSNQTTPNLSATGSVNTVPLGVYNTAVSATVGQLIPFQSTQLGNIKSQEQFVPQAEDNVNNVIAVRPLPVTASIYAWSGSWGNSLVSASVIKQSAGTVRQVVGYIDATGPTGNYFVHLYNAVTGVAKFTGTGNDLFMPIKIAHTSGTNEAWAFDFTECGLFFGTGLYIALSPYLTLYDTTGSYASWGAQYK